MELLRRSPLGSTIVAFILGLFIGLVVLGWGLLPVQYQNGLPYGLREDYKLQYVSAVADAFAVDNNLQTVEQRLGGGGGFNGDERRDLLTKLRDNARAKNDDRQVARVQNLANALKIQLGAGSTGGSGSQGGSLLSSLLGLIGLLFLLAAGAIAVYLLLRRRGETATMPGALRDRGLGSMGRPAMPTAPTMPRPTMPTMPQPEASGGFSPVLEDERAEAALGHFVTTYKLGDDGYDTSFSIETPTGDFLGECGVGISDVVGEGSPQKVTAFEVWLFDKNDIKTVTKVLMSEHAFNNEAVRKKLQARGDATLARPGSDVALETGALRVVATIGDMSYASGGAAQSFFQKLTIELAPTIKAK